MRLAWLAGMAAVVGAAGFLGAIVLEVVTPDDGELDAATRARVATDVEALAEELDDWWDTQLRPRRAGLPIPQLADGSDGVACDGERITLDEDLLENAWAGVCGEGLTVAYDPSLFADDVLTMELTMAHEWGHLVQFMVPGIDASFRSDGLPVDAELQADCFMGAWYGDARPDAPLDPAVREVQATGDWPGTPRDDPDAHGSGRERAEAFLAGHAGGVEACLP